MFKHLRGALPACALVGASLFLFTPTASAATAPTDYQVIEGVLTGVHQVSNASGDVSTLLQGQFAYIDKVAITPDGKTAYVTSINNNSVTAINLVTGVVGQPITVAGADAIAISSDGSLAYVSGTAGVTPIRLSDGHPSAPIPAQQFVRSIAFSPDGETAYLLGDDNQDVTSVLAIDVKTGTAGPSTTVDLNPGASGRVMALSPDGRTAYLPGRGTVITVDLASMALGAPIDLGGHGAPSAVAISPDGKSLWAIVVSPQSAVLRVDLAGGTVIEAPLPDGFVPLDLALTPDGRRVYVAHSHADQFPNPPAEVVWIDTTTLKPGTPIVTDDSQRGPSGGSLGITPDQAPVAKFTATVACAGTATAFDASSSTVAQGTIVRYAWDFGDGVKKVTTGPKAKHVYAKPGSYAASVTETDSAGTSTTVVFDGQTVLRNGKPTARAHHTVTITACAVSGESTNPSSGSMAASTADASLPMTGGNTTEALLLSGLLIGAGAVLARAGRRVRG